MNCKHDIYLFNTCRLSAGVIISTLRFAALEQLATILDVSINWKKYVFSVTKGTVL